VGGTEASLGVACLVACAPPVGLEVRPGSDLNRFMACATPSGLNEMLRPEEETLRSIEAVVRGNGSTASCSLLGSNASVLNISARPALVGIPGCSSLNLISTNLAENNVERSRQRCLATRG
jgi:hypothetical protein